ncbi:MAG: hypothetical protein ACI4OJ_02045 [Lachnospiraceae bacterium]
MDQDVYRGSSRRGGIRLLLLPLLAVLFVVLLSFGADRIRAGTRSAQKEALEAALARDITACYALEGIYPPNVQYLKDHYGLVYDEDLFSIGYQVEGENLRPTATVVEKGAGS